MGILRFTSGFKCNFFKNIHGSLLCRIMFILFFQLDLCIIILPMTEAILNLYNTSLFVWKYDQLYPIIFLASSTSAVKILGSFFALIFH